MNTTSNSTDSKSKLITGIFWRKNLWNGAATIPVILAFQNDTLELQDATSTIFSVPISTVTANISIFGTLTVIVGDKKYDFVGSGAALSKSFTSAQQAQIEQQNLVVSDMLVKVGTAGVMTGTIVSNIANTGAGVATQAVGAGAMAASFFIGLGAIKKWKELFIEHNLLTKGSKNSRRSVAIIFIGIFVVVFVITGVLSARYGK